MRADPHATLPRRFSIGKVLAHAWQGTSRHFVAVPVICLLAGFAGAGLPVGIGWWLPWFTLFWQHPIGLELAQMAVASAVATPAIVLLLRSYQGHQIGFRDIALATRRRVGIVVAGEVALDAILIWPASFIQIKVQVSAITIFPLFFLYEFPLLAFNYVLLPTLAAEPINLFSALRRALNLMRGRWWRMLAIAFILWLASWIIAFVAQYAFAPLEAFFRPVSYLMWQQLTTGSVSFGLRLLLVVPIATAAYDLLRQEKDGPGPEQTAVVFD